MLQSAYVTEESTDKLLKTQQQSELPGLRSSSYVKRQGGAAMPLLGTKQEKMEEIVSKLAFRQFLKESGH